MSAPIDPLLEDALRRYRAALGEAQAEEARLHALGEEARMAVFSAAVSPLVRLLQVARANEDPRGAVAELDELTAQVRTLTAASNAEPTSSRAELRPGHTSLRSALLGVTAVVAEPDALASRRAN